MCDKPNRKDTTVWVMLEPLDLFVLGGSSKETSSNDPVTITKPIKSKEKMRTKLKSLGLDSGCCRKKPNSRSSNNQVMKSMKNKEKLRLKLESLNLSISGCGSKKLSSDGPDPKSMKNKEKVEMKSFDLPDPGCCSKKSCSNDLVTMPMKNKEAASTKDKMVWESDEEWEVEEIVDHRISDGKIQYLVKWMHWPSSNNTWEPPENLQHSKSLISIYKNKDSLKREYCKLVKGETGFNMGLVCKRVRGVMQLENCPDPTGDKLFYIVEWKNSNLIDRISSTDARARIPEHVIKYWESITEWKGAQAGKKRQSSTDKYAAQKSSKNQRIQKADVIKETLDMYQEQFDKCFGDENRDPARNYN